MNHRHKLFCSVVERNKIVDYCIDNYSSVSSQLKSSIALAPK